ncbi:MAG: glutaminyl-peptide cyclotransferase [Pyrinomonadaceae bacterium]|nr:glutaminyl-peptide cyclotransferase [Pyrinomonadaceae bacterium]
MRTLLVFFTAAIALACSGTANTPKPNNVTAKAPLLPVFGYEIVKTYPHDGSAFTQGLFFYNGSLYESTGQKGRSQIRKVDIETGKVQQKWDLPKDEFGEGSTVLGDKIYMVTWQDGVGRVFDAKDLKMLNEFSYQGEGWGITTDGTNLIMSQGTHVLKVIDPQTFKQIKTIPVMREDGRPLMRLNELEFVKGEIWANVWHSEDTETLGKPNRIARIDPQTGKLIGWIDLAGISPDDQPKTNSPYDEKVENTLNGIAYDAVTDRIFVTGKQWKKLYEIKLTPPKTQ